jgi:hypothetical protein
MKNTQIYTPITNAINTFNVKYPSGTINPTERKVITRNLCVDTLFRKDYENTTPTDFIYTLPNPLTNVISMNVTAMEFPYAWYTFDSFNATNEFTIKVINPICANSGITYAPSYTHIIRIPKGNYLSDMLMTTINNIFNNTELGLELLYFEIDEASTRSIIRISDQVSPYLRTRLSENNFSIELDFTVDSHIYRPLYHNAGWMLGFTQPKYIITNETPVERRDKGRTYEWYLESETSYGNRLNTYVYIEIDDFNKNCYTDSVIANTSSKTSVGHNIIGRISVTSGINTIITNTTSDCLFKKREYFGPVRIDKLHIRLLDKFGVPIRFNGNDYSFMLEIEQLYS